MNDFDAMALLALELLTIANMIPIVGMGSYIRVGFRERITSRLIWFTLALLPTGIYAATLGFTSYRIMLEDGVGLDENARYAAIAAAASNVIVPIASFSETTKYAQAVKETGDSWSNWIGTLPETLIELTATLVRGKTTLVSVCVTAIQLSLFYCSTLGPAEIERNDTQQLVMDRLSHDYRAAFTVGGAFLACALLYRHLLNPSRVMTEKALSYFVLARKHNYRIAEIHSVYVPRWRSLQHKNAFKLAKSLTRSVSGLKTKLTKEDFEKVSETARKIAYLIRKRSVWIRDGEPDPEYSELCLAALSLAVSSNPVHAAERAEKLILHADVATSSSHPKLTAILDMTDSAIQKYSRLSLIALGFVVFILLLTTGQLSQALEFLRAVVLSGG